MTEKFDNRIIKLEKELLALKNNNKISFDSVAMQDYQTTVHFDYYTEAIATDGSWDFGGRPRARRYAIVTAEAESEFMATIRANLPYQNVHNYSWTLDMWWSSNRNRMRWLFESVYDEWHNNLLVPEGWTGSDDFSVVVSSTTPITLSVEYIDYD